MLIQMIEMIFRLSAALLRLTQPVEVKDERTMEPPW